MEDNRKRLAVVVNQNTQPSVTYTAGPGIDITNDQISLDTIYPSQSGIVEGANTLNANIGDAMDYKLPIIINGSLLTFVSDDGTTITYSRNYKGTNYSLTNSGVYTVSSLSVMTIHRP